MHSRQYVKKAVGSIQIKVTDSNVRNMHFRQASGVSIGTLNVPEHFL